jgi:hypothetical protein
MTSVLILSAGSLILSGFTFVFFLNYLKRRTSRERILAELTADFREEAAKIEREINAVTDRDVTLVEDRVKALRALLEDTDRRIAVYARELERRKSQEETFAALDRETAAPGEDVKDALSTGPGRSAAVKPGEDTVRLSAESSRPAAAPPSPAAVVKAPPLNGAAGTAPAASGYTKHVTRSARPLTPKPLPFPERVTELYRAGFSSSLIASRLGATVTEVELAIALAERGVR